MSTAKAEYVATGSACSQVLWIKNQLQDYDIFIENAHTLCDNTNAINISTNFVLHSRTKHIDNMHHFLCDQYRRKIFI